SCSMYKLWKGDLLVETNFGVAEASARGETIAEHLPASTWQAKCKEFDQQAKPAWRGCRIDAGRALIDVDLSLPSDGVAHVQEIAGVAASVGAGESLELTRSFRASSMAPGCALRVGWKHDPRVALQSGFAVPADGKGDAAAATGASLEFIHALSELQSG